MDQLIAYVATNVTQKVLFYSQGLGFSGFSAGTNRCTSEWDDCGGNALLSPMCRAKTVAFFG
jgi:hypothetical protein